MTTVECIIAMFNYIIKIDFYWKDELWDDIYSLSLSRDLSEVRAEYTGGNGFEYTVQM